MKDKINKSREHLVAAINSLPDDNALSEAKRLLRSALVRLEHAMEKRHRREDTKRQIEAEFKKKMSDAAMNATNPKQSLALLEKLINDEKQKTQKPAVMTPIQNLID